MKKTKNPDYMIKKIKKPSECGKGHCTSFDNSELSKEEIDFARYHFQKGWNSLLKVLPNVLKEEVLLSFEEAVADSPLGAEDEYFKGREEDKFVPYNREYTEDKQPMVHYFTEGMKSYWDLKHQILRKELKDKNERS